MVPPSSDRIARVPPYSRTLSLLSHTGLSPAAARLSRRFWYQIHDHWPRPLSLATTHGVSLMSFPPATEMFQFAGFASRRYGFTTGYPCGWVAPFGDPGINDRSHLPRAYRSVPRPSSPLSAKASTRCPYSTRLRRLSLRDNGSSAKPATHRDKPHKRRPLEDTLYL